MQVLYQCQWRRSGVLVINFEQILRIDLMFLMLTLIEEISIETSLEAILQQIFQYLKYLEFP